MRYNGPILVSHLGEPFSKVLLYLNLILLHCYKLLKHIKWYEYTLAHPTMVYLDLATLTLCHSTMLSGLSTFQFKKYMNSYCNIVAPSPQYIGPLFLILGDVILHSTDVYKVCYKLGSCQPMTCYAERESEGESDKKTHKKVILLLMWLI